MVLPHLTVSSDLRCACLERRLVWLRAEGDFKAFTSCIISVSPDAKNLSLDIQLT